LDLEPKFLLCDFVETVKRKGEEKQFEDHVFDLENTAELDLIESNDIIEMKGALLGPSPVESSGTLGNLVAAKLSTVSELSIGIPWRPCELARYPMRDVTDYVPLGTESESALGLHLRTPWRMRPREIRNQMFRPRLLEHSGLATAINR
jgi:hypothetical protein